LHTEERHKGGVASLKPMLGGKEDLRGRDIVGKAFMHGFLKEL